MRKHEWYYKYSAKHKSDFSLINTSGTSVISYTNLANDVKLFTSLLPNYNFL